MRTRPMLAHAITVHGAKSLAAYMAALKRVVAACASDDFWMEEKYDGHRVLIAKSEHAVRAWNRPHEGRDAVVCNLEAHLVAAVRDLPDGFYDGERIVPGGMSTDVGRRDRAHAVRLVLFDVMELLGVDVTSKTARERRELLTLAVEHHVRATDNPLISVPVRLEVSMDTVRDIWIRGGEGAIIKRAAAPYQRRRSKDWQKVKRLGHTVVTIIGFESGERGPYARTKVRDRDGREFTVSTLDRATIADISRNPAAYVRKRLVIHYTERMPSGAYRHPGWDHLAGAEE
jgi:ATP-dependent DNA ligase